jgi:hypothetical protein
VVGVAPWRTRKTVVGLGGTGFFLAAIEADHRTAQPQPKFLLMNTPGAAPGQTRAPNVALGKKTRPRISRSAGERRPIRP